MLLFRRRSIRLLHHHNDVVRCAAFSELIITNPLVSYDIAPQLLVDNSTNLILQIDSIVTATNIRLFNVTGTHHYELRWYAGRFRGHGPA